MISHPVATLLLAALVSLAAALPGDRSRGECVCRAAYTFFTLTATVVAGGWLMYFVHG